MVVNGLNKDLFLIGNPIWIEVSGLQEGVKYFEVVVSNIANPAQAIVSKPVRVGVFGTSVRYDLREVIKGNFPAPEFPASTSIKFSISIMEVIGYTAFYSRPDPANPQIGILYTVEETKAGDVATFSKTFIRGWKKTMENNVSLSAGAELRESDLIPRWGGYPSMRFYLDAGNKMVGSSFIPADMTEDMKIVGCDPLYVRYLNSLGGYSYWLFEVHEEVTKNTSGDYVTGYNRYDHTGFQTKISVEAETRADKSYFKALQGLLRSPEVHLYNRYGVEWAKVILNSGEIKENNYENGMKLSVSFGIITQEKASTLW